MIQLWHCGVVIVQLFRVLRVAEQIGAHGKCLLGVAESRVVVVYGSGAIPGHLVQ